MPPSPRTLLPTVVQGPGVGQREIEAVIAAGGQLSLAAALRCRVRYFIDGAALGNQKFVDGLFEPQREYFRESRTSGARKMRGAQSGALKQ